MKKVATVNLKALQRDWQAWKDYEGGKTREPKGFSTVRVLLPPKPADIKRWRRGLKLTQAGLARLLNAGTYAVRSWEQGRRVPDGPVTLLMRLMRDEPKVLAAALKETQVRLPH